MAEALIAKMGKGRFHAYSAGSHPTGRVNPFAIEQVAAVGYPIDSLRSKSWDEFAQPDAPKMDFIITVCDNARESCPVFPAAILRMHWPFEDPAAVHGSDAEREAAFRKVRDQIRRRIVDFLGTHSSFLLISFKDGAANPVKQ